VDDEVTAPLKAELDSRSKQASRLGADREAISQLCNDRENMRLRMADMASWCQTVAANIEQVSYDQKRLALDAYGVQVQLWAKGDRDPQWEITAFPEILLRSSCSLSKSQI
jgi:site-specific DNA recombinase